MLRLLGCLDYNCRFQHILCCNLSACRLYERQLRRPLTGIKQQANWLWVGEIQIIAAERLLLPSTLQLQHVSMLSTHPYGLPAEAAKAVDRSLGAVDY